MFYIWNRRGRGRLRSAVAMTALVMGAGGAVGAVAVAAPAYAGPGGIVNGGFENGHTGLFNGSLSGWTTTGTTSISFTTHSGSAAAQLGSVNPTLYDSTVGQTFIVPAGQNKLSFWYDNVCPDTLTYDWATVILHDNTTSATITPLPKTCVSNSGWVPVSVLVTPGDSYNLTLLNHDDDHANDGTYTLFDDVMLSTQTIALTTPSWAHVSYYGQVTWDKTNYTPYIIAGYIISRDSDYAYAIVPGNAFSYVDPSNDGHAHSYQVRAYVTGTNIAEVSAPSPTTTEPPLNLYRTVKGQVCWDPVVSHNGSGDGYHIYAGGTTTPVDSVNAAGHDPGTAVCWAPTGSYTNSWTPGSTQSIIVRTYNTGVNGGADESDGSNPLSYVYVPAPTGVQLFNECNRDWQIMWDPAPDAATYNIYANGALIAQGLTTDYNGYSYEFASPLNETYTVTAVDAQSHESVVSAAVSNPIWDPNAC